MKNRLGAGHGVAPILRMRLMVRDVKWILRIGGQSVISRLRDCIEGWGAVDWHRHLFTSFGFLGWVIGFCLSIGCRYG